jgi:hypothetical protein
MASEHSAQRDQSLWMRVLLVATCEIAILWRLVPAMTSPTGISVPVGIVSALILCAPLVAYIRVVKGWLASLIGGVLLAVVSLGYFMPNAGKLAHIDDGLEGMYVVVTAGCFIFIVVSVVEAHLGARRVPPRPDH